MRLELALVVGILLFCSWCAYIVARMSSSVNADGQTPSSDHQAAPDKQHRLINQTGPQTAILIDHLPLQPTASGEQQPVETNLNTNSDQQPLRQFGASEPVPTRQTPTGQYHWAPYANQPQTVHPQHQLYSQPQAPVQFQSNGNGQWQAYALPTASNNSPVQEEQELQEDDDRKLEDDSKSGEAERAQASADSGELDYEGFEGDSSQIRPVEGEEAAEQGEADNEEGAASSIPTEGDEGDEELEQELPPVQNELEEISNRRSFEELESDERERDRDGHLVQSSRKHLINGKPVGRQLRSNGHVGQRLKRRKATRRSGRHDDGNGQLRLLSASSGRKQTTLPAAKLSHEPEVDAEVLDQEEEDDDESGPQSLSESDFEGMVREIDHEDKLQRAAAKAVAPPPPSSQTVDAVEANAGLVSVSGDQLGGLGAVSSGATTPANKPQPPTTMSGGGADATGSGAPERRQDQDGARLQVADSSKRPTRVGVANLNNNNNNNMAKGLSQKTGASLAAKKDAKAAARDSHEHRVRETFQAQQWDDDSDSLPEGEAAEAASREVEELRRDEDQERVGNIVERDDEARQLERLSRRLLKQSVQVPEELERRKRHAPSGGRADRGQTLSVIGSKSRGGGAHEMTRVDNDEAPPDHGLLSLASVHVGERAVRLMGPSSAGQSGEPGPFDGDGGGSEIIDQIPGRVWSLGVNSTTLSNNITLGADNVTTTSDVVSGSEDMHVAVLAQAPPLLAQANASSLLLANPQANVQVPVQAQAQAVGGHRAWPKQNLSPHVASGSHQVTAKRKSGRQNKKKLVKRKRSKLLESKYKAARAHANRQMGRMKKGKMNKKRRKFEKESLASRKHFEGLTKGKKLGRGRKSEGAKKGSAYLKDKGYKKKGFKRSYHKLETGDHKTYFDEFRDKDQKRRWKDSDDKHKYSQKKKWAGYDSKHHNKHKLHQAKGQASKLGKWRERSELDHSRQANKYKGSKRLAATEGSLSKSARLKRKKKKKKKHKSYSHK